MVKRVKSELTLAELERENAERKARRDVATPGPWIITLGSGHNLCTAVQSECNEDGTLTPIADCLAAWMLDGAAKDHTPNTNFIAAARDDQAPERIDALLSSVRELRAALEVVMMDAGLEDDYEQRDSDGRFISKSSLLKCRIALARYPEKP